MEELIFFAVIIFFSILESISRSRKAKQKRQEQGPDEAEQFEWAQTPPWEVDLPTYDDDPSYDETAVAADDYMRTEPSVRESEPPSPQSVAAEIWSELTGIAPGETKERGTILIPRQSPPIPERHVPVEVARQVAVRSGSAVHPVHLTHADYGTDPSTRPQPPEALYPLGEALSADAARARAQLLGTRSSLRQAIILREVLGPPLSLRDEL